LSSSARKVLLSYPVKPFAWGGTEHLASSLARRLSRRGFLVETLTLPWIGGSKIADLGEALHWSDLDLAESYPHALFVGTKYPSYLPRHPNKVVWLFHQYRELYDLYGGELSSYKNEVLDHDVREILLRLDRERLSAARRIFSISANVAKRLERYSGMKSEVLYPPSPLSGRLASRAYGDYVMAVSRLDRNKRVELLIEAAAQVEGITVVVVGEGPLREPLEKRAGELELSSRVKFLGRVSDQELIDLYAEARAVFVGPIDEDYGLVAVEALEAARPVVATRDCGGPLELIEDQVSGIVVEPEPQEVARALRRLFEDSALCRRWGQSGAERVRRLDWDEVVDRLTS
jgi:glycosyltransferase involved in cell wall biosynthesis